MRIRSLSLALLLAAALPAQSLKEQRFTVLVGENRTGTTLLTWTDPNHASVATATSVRGLRFSGHGTYTFDGQGLLTSLEARSEASLGAPQTEHFLWKDGRAEWDSTIEHGRADVKVPGFYVSAAAGDAVETGFLVQALRRAPGQTLALLPEGRARLRTLGKEKLGSLQVELVEVTGLGLDPAMAWLDPALVPILVQEAHARGLRVSGHIPKDLYPRAAVAAGYDEIQHIYFPLMQLLPEGWPHHNDAGRMQVPADKVGTLDLDGPEAQAWLAFLKAHHTALDPTISLWENLLMDRPGQRPAMLAPLWDRLPLLMRRGSLGGGLDAAGDKVSLDFLKRAHALGIPLVPGTDGPSGIQLHRELEVMVLAGIPAGDVLRQATYGSALVMGRTADLGSIAPGKAADLILLDGDPTQDIAAVRKIIWVLHDGRKLDREATLEALGLGLPAPHAGP